METIRKLLFELIVVFVGVYGAFALEPYQREQEADARKQQMIDALYIEMMDSNLPVAGPKIVARIDSLFTRYK